MQVSSRLGSVIVASLLACSDAPRANGPLASAVAALGEHSFECESVQSWPVRAGTPPFSACRSVSGDTTFLKVSDAIGEVVMVGRRWDSASDASLFDQLSSRLTGSHGVGRLIVAPDVDRHDRQMAAWELDDHYLTLRWEPSERRVYEIWALGAFEQSDLSRERPPYLSW